MDRVRKTYFNPLATSKAGIRQFLNGLPVGSAHPYSPQRILLRKSENGIEEIDISSYPEDFFFNAVDIGEMRETLLRRMARFPSELGIFNEYEIAQAPASTFKVPIVDGQIVMLAVSERQPTYYDFCFADEDGNACCYSTRTTFPGLCHSGDVCAGLDFLAYVNFNKENLTRKELCVFISGFQKTQITRFLGTHPALLVADHDLKVSYIVPVPLDTATIGDATICCPMVIKRDGDLLVCSILPTATKDRDMMCSSNKMKSACFPEAIRRANFRLEIPQSNQAQASTTDVAERSPGWMTESLKKIMTKETAVFTTNSVAVPPFLDLEGSQIINFGTNLEFKMPDGTISKKSKASAVVLPCVFGSLLQGPFLLATGRVPINVPFTNETDLRKYYEQLKSVVFVVNDRMTDNARNLAGPWRINALFIVQLDPQDEPKNTDDIIALLDAANINAVTALAGPQSLVVVQISDKYYFYRGLANRAHLETSKLAFGADVTSIITSTAVEYILDPRAMRLVNLEEANHIILPKTGQLIKPQDLHKLLAALPADRIRDLGDSIRAAVPQLQILLNEKDLQALSKALVDTLSTKISVVTGPLRDIYVKFLTEEHVMNDPESDKKKRRMLGELRKATKEMQTGLQPVISSLANMMSAQTTSKRTHDLKRLIRQTQIQGNVEAAKSMTYDALAGYLETYAGDMGVMLLNIDTARYSYLLSGLKNAAIDATSSCTLDSRLLHLGGFDAGIIMEQSQGHHAGPLQSQAGPSHPTMALPYLSEGKDGFGSMIAWVCWDEFVDLENPYTVRWMEKCNEAHIAALRIIMRGTLSQAISSREHDLQPGSPDTGKLMSALLMAAMSKLAAMRTSVPGVVAKAEDTVIRLMRGLFGNLLTTAGSGVRPMSMVWQLFGLDPQFDVPSTQLEWVWYEKAVALYPYTGWPREEFYGNLEKLLDKVLLRVVTKNENVAEMKLTRAAKMVEYCKLRNIQLDHSRTIITTLMRMLTTQGLEVAPIAKRLLEQLPEKGGRNPRSYTRMIKYLQHLAAGGEQRTSDNLVAANVYTTRSASFSTLKKRVVRAYDKKNWATMKEACEGLVEKHAIVAKLWGLEPESFRYQNWKVYKQLSSRELGDTIDQHAMNKHEELIGKVRGDAETKRTPWQVGKPGEFGDELEPLNETFVHEMLTGEKIEPIDAHVSKKASEPVTDTAIVESKANNEFTKFGSTLKPGFVANMQKNLSAEQVCSMMQVSVPAMRVFVKALNPEYVWDDLGGDFKEIMLYLLEERSGRAESCPTRRMLKIGGKMLRIKG